MLRGSPFLALLLVSQADIRAPVAPPGDGHLQVHAQAKADSPQREWEYLQQGLASGTASCCKHVFGSGRVVSTSAPADPWSGKPSWLAGFWTSKERAGRVLQHACNHQLWHAHPEIVWQRLQGLAACLLGRSHVVIALVPVGTQQAARTCMLICTHKSQVLLDKQSKWQAGINKAAFAMPDNV